MGATPVSPEESALALRDATIAELRRSLADLRPLGEQLAEVEKARLALESELAELRLDVARMEEEQHAELTALTTERDKARRACTRLEERAGKLKEKFTKRDRVATERWHQIRSLQQERRELREQLKEAERSPVDLANGRPPAASPDLANLFGSEASEVQEQEAPSVQSPPDGSDSRPLRT